MNTKKTPKTFNMPQTPQEMDELTRKVKESETYKHSYYVLRITTIKSKGRKPKITWYANFEGLTKEEAEACADGLNKNAEQYHNTGERTILFKTANYYDCYYDYLQASGTPKPRAQQWEDIKHRFTVEENARIANWN